MDEHLSADSVQRKNNTCHSLLSDRTGLWTDGHTTTVLTLAVHSGNVFGGAAACFAPIQFGWALLLDARASLPSKPNKRVSFPLVFSSFSLRPFLFQSHLDDTIHHFLLFTRATVVSCASIISTWLNHGYYDGNILGTISVEGKLSL